MTAGPMQSQLASWGLTEAEARQAGIFYTASAKTIYPEMGDHPAAVIPYYLPDGTLRTYVNGTGAKPFARLRLLEDGAHKPHGFTKRKTLRYLQPSHSGVAPYFWPGADWAAISADPAVPVLITEGEAKAIRGCLAGFTVIALGGVFSFTDRAGELLPEMAAIAWEGRPVYVVYDSDAATNPNVLAAEARLVDELGRKRGAKCHIARLPSNGDKKMGLDDYLTAYGATRFASLLQEAPALGALDAKVMSLNASIAWIEREGLAYDLRSKLFISKENLTSGSLYSTYEHVTIGAGGRVPKRISVAKTWLTHPHAARFDEILFRPGEPTVLRGEHNRSALNMWTPCEAVPGDVQPFLDLTDHMFQNLPEDHRDLPLKLMIYKAQHPERKVPLAIMLVGEQGSGKSLWGVCIRAAFSPYAVEVTPENLSGEFQGWLEKSLICTVNEARPEDLQKASEKLKALISDLQRPMNEKYRPSRQINAYAMYILITNKRGAAAFSADDRRMIIVPCPEPREGEFYDRVLDWLRAGGGPALMHWMQAYDLKGWEPPAKAPLSAEKHMAYVESLTPTQRLAEEMRTGTTHSLVLWLDSAVAWARAAELSTNTAMASAARATLSGVMGYQIRPWYQPEELALMFPAIVSQLLGSKFSNATPAGVISRELRDAGIPYLQSADDPRGFMWQGRLCQFLVVSDFKDWAKPLRQADFERLMRGWPTYGQIKAGKA